MKDYSFLLEYILPLEKWSCDDFLDGYTHYFLSSYSKVLFACIVAPHKGTDFKWMLRITNRENFDKWIYCQYEEFFDDPFEIIKILEEFDTETKLPEDFL